MKAALNIAALLAALVAGMFMVSDERTNERAVQPVGPTFVVDATGAEVPVRRYERIASASTIADQVLAEIVEPSRVVAVTRQSHIAGPAPWRFTDKPALAELQRLEAVLALQPDLVIVANVASPRPIARLREAGLEVFDIGAMHGLSTFLADIRTVGEVVGESERAERMARGFERRIARVASRPRHAAPRVLYVDIVSNDVYGGAAGTNYHDVLVSAGLLIR